MSHKQITIITPCYNESVIVVDFLRRIEGVLARLPYSFCIVVVNDGSTDDTLSLLKGFGFTAPNIFLNILELDHNVGHQVAIYRGLSFARAFDCQYFIIMDSDGQDSVEAIPLILDKLDADIVHVVRGKRNESLSFQLFYKVYKVIFRLITGKQMNFGNFCLISRPVLEMAVASSFTHFPVFLSKQRCIVRSIVVERESRIGGESKMGFTKLVGHAFRSFAEYWNVAPVVKMHDYKTIVPEQKVNNANFSR